MKYLYYALYLFDEKIAHVKDFYPPIITVTGTMAFLIGALCYSIVNVFENEMNHEYPYYSVIIALSVYLALYKRFYDYYKVREDKLLKEMKCKPMWVKILSIVGSVCFIVLVVKLWIFEGMSDLYQFVKMRLFHV